MNSRTTDAIVLRWYPYRSFDRRVIAYTRDLGKIDAVARGTQRMTSKLAGSLEPLRYIQLTIAHGPKNDQVIGAVVNESYRSLAERLPRYAAACAVSELLDQLVKPYTSDERLFDLVLATLKRLNDPEPLFRGFVDVIHLQMMAALGYAPELRHCVLTGEDADDGVFDPIAGGFVVQSAARSSHLPVFTRTHRNILTDLLAHNAPLAQDPVFPQDLTRAFRDFVMSRLDRPLQSDAFLTAILAA